MSSREQTTRRLPSIRPARAESGARALVPPVSQLRDVADDLERYALGREKNLLLRDVSVAANARRLAAHVRFLAAGVESGLRNVAPDWERIRPQIALFVEVDAVGARQAVGPLS